MDVEGVPVDTNRCERFMESLIYISHIKLDIAFSVSEVTQFIHAPYKHLKDVYWILRYLKGIIGKWLFLWPQSLFM